MGLKFDLIRGTITNIIEDVMVDRSSRSSKEPPQIQGDFLFLKRLLKESMDKARKGEITFDIAIKEAWHKLSREKVKQII